MALSLSRFRGCLLGALAGDCLGSRYEMEHLTDNEENDKTFRQRVFQFIGQFPNGHEKKPMMYTDDTAMLRSVAESLITREGFDPSDMARRFAETYFSDNVFRAYGGNISIVFEKLKKTNYADPFEPANQQFGGSGSYGNGGAMRVAPSALFHPKDLDKALEVARNQCLLTHTHPDGVMGAVIQAASVHLALNSEPGKIDQKEFCAQLRTIMQKQETLIYTNFKNRDDNPYNVKLDSFGTLLDDNASIITVARNLGTGIAAIRSVPAAIFSFIRCLKPCDEVEIENPLVRTLTYAISLGGDTDTIATMAGAIAGAYYGDSYISKNWISSLEGSTESLTYAHWFHKRLK